jgi:hypothetical protein
MLPKALSRKSALSPRPIAFLLLTFAYFLSLRAEDPAWILPRTSSDPLIWGRRDGIVFGLPSAGGMRGPRGLIRVGTVDEHTGEAHLLNFIAVEPVVVGKKARGDRMAFSELESSRLDPGKHGARLWVANEVPGSDSPARNDAYGQIHKERNGRTEIERLTVRVEIERFPGNGAHVYLLLSIASDHPNELRLSAYPYADGKPLDEMVFTATMGAYERLRFLWLKDRVVDSRVLYAGYNQAHFAEVDPFGLDIMLRDSDGDAIALCTSSEQDPSAARNPQAKPEWYYDGVRFTQYWRIPAKEIAPNLRVRVNGRYMYWNSHDAIPEGITFENFELRERYVPGQTFIFGISRREPFAWTPAFVNLGVSPPLENGSTSK